MLTINYKQIYETKEFGIKQWILILYDISANHYVGIPVYSKEKDDCIYLNSIKKYVDVNKISDYNRTKMIKCIYQNNKPLKLSKKDFNRLLTICKEAIIGFLNNDIPNDINGISYLKWCKDKYNLNSRNIEVDKLKQNGIYWINMGVNVGSELRKLRPAILWRATGDKKTWTIIPLTTKKRNDNYYFHYDLECLSEGSAKIENIMNYSYKRIIAPYFSKNKLAILTEKDYKEISKIISKYYLFK